MSAESDAATGPLKNGPLAGVPIWAALACPLWLVFLMMGLLFMVGDTPYHNTPANEQMFAMLASLPAAGGVVCGIIALATGQARTNAMWIGTIIGTVICGIWSFACFADYIR
jgi:hypothetical protein